MLLIIKLLHFLKIKLLPFQMNSLLIASGQNNSNIIQSKVQIHSVCVFIKWHFRKIQDLKTESKYFQQSVKGVHYENEPPY